MSPLSLTPNSLGTANPSPNADDSSIPSSPFCYPGIIYPSEVGATVTTSAASLGTKNPSTNTPGTLTLTPH